MVIERQISISGTTVPTFMYGTAWKEGATHSCVREALSAGFRAIDTANQRKHYFEAGVGAALLEAYDSGSVSRQDLFLQTKFTFIDGQDHRLPYDPDADIRTQVLQSFASSLEHLHTEYIDSYVLHGPSQRTGLGAEDWEAWRAMEELQQSGKIKLLGVSNVALEQLQTLQQKSTVGPSFVQNRCYAVRGWDREVRAFCSEHGIRYQGFSLLTANTAIAASPRFKELVSRYQCTPAQLIFCFALQAAMLPLTGTTDSAHMREDLGTYAFTLDADDMRTIERIAE